MNAPTAVEALYKVRWSLGIGLLHSGSVGRGWGIVQWAPRAKNIADPHPLGSLVAPIPFACGAVPANSL